MTLWGLPAVFPQCFWTHTFLWIRAQRLDMDSMALAKPASSPLLLPTRDWPIQTTAGHTYELSESKVNEIIPKQASMVRKRLHLYPSDYWPPSPVRSCTRKRLRWVHIFAASPLPRRAPRKSRPLGRCVHSLFSRVLCRHAIFKINSLTRAECHVYFLVLNKLIPWWSLRFQTPPKLPNQDGPVRAPRECGSESLLLSPGPRISPSVGHIHTWFLH